MNFLKRGMLISLSTAMVAVLLLLLRASPVPAQEPEGGTLEGTGGINETEYFCNGSTGIGCDIFQLDGSAQTSANAEADTCVKSEGGPCSTAGEESPVWPADWDPLIYPGSFGVTSTFKANSNVGGGVGPGTFTTPWGNSIAYGGVTPTGGVVAGLGTKLLDDLSSYTVSIKSSPPKDAFVAAALAAYTNPSNKHLQVYFGDTRSTSNGSATIGIMFNQENVQLCANGTQLCVDGTTTLATHKNGDVVLFVQFGGSGFASIQALQLINGTWTSVTAVACPSAGDTVCAIANAAASITLGAPSSAPMCPDGTTGVQCPGTGFNPLPSAFTKFTGFVDGVVGQNQFEEGGADLTSFFTGGVPCFGSVVFASITSGSSPFSASVKSLLLANFNTCSISATKTCGTPTANVAANTLTYPISGTVQNTGGGTVANLSIADNFNGSSQALDSGTLGCTCGTGCTISGTDCTTVNLNPGGTVTYSATITTMTNGAPDIVTATMGGAGGGSASAQSNTATCNPQFFPDSVTISKNCSPGASLVVSSTTPPVVEVKVGVDGVVTNGSSGGLTLTNVTVHDCVNGTFAAPGPGTCPTVAASSCTGTLRTLPTIGSVSSTAPWSDAYFPSVAPSGAPFNFSDQVLVSASCTSQFCTCSTVQNVANKTCPLCPGP